MTLNIDFINETAEDLEDIITKIRNVLNFAANKKDIEQYSELSITFVNNERIREINKEYRNKDKATDVISFAMEDLGEGEIVPVGVDMPRVLGDIIISVDKAKEQSEDYGHSYLREVVFLAVHGFLHLLGYDHETEEEEKEMFSLQREILDEFGLQR